MFVKHILYLEAFYPANFYNCFKIIAYDFCSENLIPKSD